MEETVARKFCGAIPGSTSNRARADCSRLAHGNPAEEWPERSREARIRCGAGASVAGGGGGGGGIGLARLHAMVGGEGGGLWVASEPTDMRCGYHLSAGRGKARMGWDGEQGEVLVFRAC